MALNPFFLNGSQTEQSLVQDLINEQLRMYGVEVYYMPRSYLTTNTVIKEVVQSEFNNAYPIEAYVDNYEGYGGQGTILSKFGIEGKDDLTLIISQERYSNYIGLLTQDLPNLELTNRPKEGDIIYFPLGDRLFEIKYVEHEQPFYQLQKNYVYELKCELFRLEDEVIDTDIDFIDDEIEQLGHIQTLSLISSGIGTAATGITSYCAAGSVQIVTINNMGKNYSTPPQVAFSSAPAGGVTATGIASITFDYPGCFGGKDGRVAAVLLTNAGCGYTEAPWITFSGGGGTGAAATTGICTMGSVQSIIVTGGGGGYVEAPIVTIDGSSVSFFEQFDSTNTTFDATIHTWDNNWRSNVGVPTAQAIGIATINSAGVVTDAYIINAGCGYTQAPEVTFSAPTVAGFGTTAGVGTYEFNEIVVGSTSGTTARVKKFTRSSMELEIAIVDGFFTSGELIIGQESGASYMLRGQEEFDLVSGFADNDNIELEADGIIDFSENNPFGMP
tara:strand:+ start:3210 stop:4712 length:1503 start_codon:yes stop_codon:yes gene_type:complete